MARENELNQQTLLFSKVRSAIQECDAHVGRIRRGVAKLSRVFPLTEKTFASLDDDTIGKIDQFIYRFTKLQDAMGLRLFPSLYSLLEEVTEPRPFLDILNRLEKLGVLTSVQEWQEFQALRNNLAHDYPESIAQTVATLNTLFERWPAMEALYTRARSKAASHLPDEG